MKTTYLLLALVIVILIIILSGKLWYGVIAAGVVVGGYLLNKSKVITGKGQELQCTIYDHGNTQNNCDPIETLQSIKWMHGTKSSTLCFLDKQNPRLVNIGTLLFENHVVPYAGELDEGIAISGTNIISGISVDVYDQPRDLERPIEYATGNYAGTDKLNSIAVSILKNNVEGVFNEAYNKYKNREDATGISDRPSETNLYVKLMRYKQLENDIDFIQKLKQQYDEIKDKMPHHVVVRELTGLVQFIKDGNVEEYWEGVQPALRNAIKSNDEKFEDVEGYLQLIETRSVVGDDDSVMTLCRKMMIPFSNAGKIDMLRDTLKKALPKIEFDLNDATRRITSLEFALSPNNTPLHVSPELLNKMNNWYPIILASNKTDNLSEFSGRAERTYSGSGYLGKNINILICRCSDLQKLVGDLREFNIEEPIRIICNNTLFDPNKEKVNIFKDLGVKSRFNQIYNEQECLDNGYYWGDDICWSNVKDYNESTIDQVHDEQECTNRGFYWNGNKCWLKHQDFCKSNNLVFYEGKCWKYSEYLTYSQSKIDEIANSESLSEDEKMYDIGKWKDAVSSLIPYQFRNKWNWRGY
jgi:hypothetical protein